MEQNTPNFDSIKNISPYGTEYWSARELSKLLGYSQWRNFEASIKKAQISCEQTGQVVADHFANVSKMIDVGKGAQREINDYFLSRMACYLIAQNSDPRKPEIAAAQVYFAIATRENELHHLKAAQEERLRLRERLSDNNKALNEAAYRAGVLTKSFGIFHNAGYKGMYGGMEIEEIKARKGIAPKEELMDRAGRSELAANDFRVTQTEERLRTEGIIGQTQAIITHEEVGRKVRAAIKDIGGKMPEDLLPEPSLKPLLEERKRNRKKSLPLTKTKPGEEEQGTLF